MSELVKLHEEQPTLLKGDCKNANQSGPLQSKNTTSLELKDKFCDVIQNSWKKHIKTIIQEANLSPKHNMQSENGRNPGYDGNYKDIGQSWLYCRRQGKICQNTRGKDGQ